MRARLSVAAAAVLLALSAISAQPQTRTPEERLASLIPSLEKNLRENIIPFWFPRSVDREHGGYTVHYGPKGEPLPGGTKAVVTQARTLWLAARLMPRSGNKAHPWKAGYHNGRAVIESVERIRALNQR